MPSSIRHARAAVLVVAAALALGASTVRQVSGQADGAPYAVAVDIDPATAPSDAVVDTLHELDEAVATRADGVAVAEAAEVTATTELQVAAEALTETERRVAALDDVPAIEDTGQKTVAPPTSEMFGMLHADTLATTPAPSDSGDGDGDEPTSLAEARAQLAAATQREAGAADAADREAAAAEAAAAALAETQPEESDFVATVEDRVAGNLADADSVAPTDPDAADALRADEAAIAGSIDEIATAREQREAAAAAEAAEQAEAAAAETDAADDESADGEDAAAADETDAAAPAEPPATLAAPAPAPAPAPPPPLPDPTGSVSGVLAPVWCADGSQIVVDGSIGGSVQALVNDAQAWGIGLCAKSGFRSYAEQVELRRANCGDSDHGIFVAPPSTCSPPTARPGTSNHEGGLAIDFSCSDGQPMTHASPCYQWLADHAGFYGLYNLPSEPWHWSVTGR